MTLLAGDELKNRSFFRGGNPKRRASSFDLTVGGIFNDEGEEISGLYNLQPNEMVQVISAEVFDLPPDITAHVSYKTGMTSKGIWALTVGIVDPGWDCPVSTTLFNFSKVPFPIGKGDVFLRVSFFQHSSVTQAELTKGPTTTKYNDGVRKTAMALFGRQFLNTDRVAEDAGRVAMAKMRDSALGWIASIAFLLAVLQLLVSWSAPASVGGRDTAEKFHNEIKELREKLEAVTDRLKDVTISDKLDKEVTE